MIASTAVLLAVVVVVFFAITWVQLDKLADEQAEARGEAVDQVTRQTGVSISQTIAAASSVALAEGGYTFIQRLLETTARSSPDVLWMVVADESGRIVADSRGARGVARAAPLPPAVAVQARARPGASVELPRAGAGPRILATAILGRDELADGADEWTAPDAVVAPAEVIGFVEVATDTGVHEREAARARQAARERVGDTARLAAIAAVVLLVLGVVVAVQQSLGIARPLRQLSAQARRIAHGEIGQVEPSGAAEIRELSTNLNHMATRLGQLLVETAKKASLEKEVEIAQLVQKSLVPPSRLVRVDSIDLVGYFEPASKCAGDWWLWRQLENGRVLLLIGDVTGHGLPSALIAATAIGSAQTLPRNVTADRALMHLNDAVLRAARGEFAMSCFAAVIDAERQVIEFSSAGHPLPYIVRRAGKKHELASLVARGPLLGIHEVPQFKLVERPLQPDDVIVLFTDGVTESRGPDGTDWGERRMQRALLESVQPASDADLRPTLTDVRGRIIGALRAFAGDGPPRDDITLVLAQIKPTAVARPRVKSVSGAG